MTDKEMRMLLKYELPSIAEYCSISWIQEVIARYPAMKIDRKWVRYQKRLQREKFLTSYKNKL